MSHATFNLSQLLKEIANPATPTFNLAIGNFYRLSTCNTTHHRVILVSVSADKLPAAAALLSCLPPELLAAMIPAIYLTRSGGSAPHYHTFNGEGGNEVDFLLRNFNASGRIVSNIPPTNPAWAASFGVDAISTDAATPGVFVYRPFVMA